MCRQLSSTVGDWERLCFAPDSRGKRKYSDGGRGGSCRRTEGFGEMGGLTESSQLSSRQVLVTAGGMEEFRQPGRVLDVKRPWTRRNQGVLARRGEGQSVADRRGVATGGVRLTGMRAGDGDKASADHPTDWNLATLSPPERGGVRGSDGLGGGPQDSDGRLLFSILFLGMTSEVQSHATYTCLGRFRRGIAQLPSPKRTLPAEDGGDVALFC